MNDRCFIAYNLWIFTLFFEVSSLFYIYLLLSQFLWPIDLIVKSPAKQHVNHGFFVCENWKLQETDSK